MNDTRNALLIKWWHFTRALAHRYARYARTDVEDLRQMIALAALEEFGDYDAARGEFSTWLGWVALRVAGRQSERTARRARAAGDDGSPLDELPDRREQDPAKAAAGRELADRVRAAVANLEPRLRKTITKRYGLDGRGERCLAKIDPTVTLERNRQVVVKGLEMVRAALAPTAVVAAG